MTITQLEYLVALDTYRNFGLASEKCMVTQPTLSMQIKKLEKTLGISIFKREKQPITPTAAGNKIISQARVILREAKKVEQIVKEQKRLMKDTLQLGIIPTIAPYLLPYFLGPFSQQYPEIRLEIIELKTEEIVRRLQKDLLDIGILATPLHEPDIIEDPIYYEEILIYLNPAHPLYQLKEIPPQELVTSDLWMLSEGNCFRDHVINLCHMRAELPIKNLKYESGSLETLKKMVDVEGGYTLLPELAVLEMPSKEITRIRQFTEPVPLREVSLVSAQNATKQNLLDRIKEVILEQLPELIIDKSRGHMVEWK